MSTPVLLAIVLNLQSTLQAIAVSGGYFNNVKSTSVVLDPQSLGSVPSTEMPFMIVGHRVEIAAPRMFTSRGTGGSSSMKVSRRIVLEAALDAGSPTVDGKITAISQFVSDVEAALVKDIRRGNLAQDTKVEDETMYMGQPGQTRCFVEIPIVVDFQRVYGKP